MHGTSLLQKNKEKRGLLYQATTRYIIHMNVRKNIEPAQAHLSTIIFLYC